MVGATTACEYGLREDSCIRFGFSGLRYDGVGQNPHVGPRIYGYVTLYGLQIFGYLVRCCTVKSDLLHSC